MALVVPADSPFALSAYGLTLVGKILCYALCAVALDLVWATAGSSRSATPLLRAGRLCDGDVPDAPDRPRRRVPERPAGLHGVSSTGRRCRGSGRAATRSSGRSDGAAGAGAARLRVRLVRVPFARQGVYLSIITQALTYAACCCSSATTRLRRQQRFTDFKRILGFPIAAIETRVVLFVLSGLALVGGFLACRAIVQSKLGRVVAAVRDAESRVMFLGYDPLPYKLFVWTFSACSAASPGRCTCRRSGSSTRARWRRRTRSRW